ncbi:MAG TPA: TIGR02281 family clan AA aspartic protease [Hyphomicrobium sp.]|nr:TIGR02281 family clan AA aspartic protease [Hyphomicrobium sp.]
MSVSSGTASLFASVAFFIAISAGAAYVIKHKDDVYRTVAELSGRPLPANLKSSAADVIATAEDGSEQTYDSSGNVTLRASDYGHFETTAEINGRDVEVMVDTGATMVALTYEDAERAGIYLTPSDFTHQVSTANGVARVAPIQISTISIGNITVRNVRGAVSERGNLHRTLLGMTFLGRLSRVEMRRNDLVLHE